jgi:hypothetical protein
MSPGREIWIAPDLDPRNYIATCLAIQAGRIAPAEAPRYE